MGAVLNKELFSGSIDATIEEIDARSCGTSASSSNDIRIGPFAVLNFSHNVQKLRDSPPDSSSRQITETACHNASTNDVLPLVVRESSLMPDLPEFTDDLLQWSDIFGLNDDLYGITSNFSLDLTSYPDFSSHPDWLTYDDTTCNILNNPTTLDQTTEMPHIPLERQEQMPTQNITPASPEPSIDILNDAPFLLHIFQKNVVPQLTIVPFGRKASWSILNVPAALITLGDLTILESQDVSHARQANLFSLLACAAVYLAMGPCTDSNNQSQLTHWRQVARSSYNKAKDHTLLFVKDPVNVPKAKYKDRTMAICGMIEAAVRYAKYAYTNSI